MLNISPASGKGVEIAAVANFPINERFNALARIGYWHWQAEYRLNSVSGNATVRTTGNDGTAGAALSAAIKDGWSARFAWDYYYMHDTTTYLYSLGVTKALNF